MGGFEVVDQRYVVLYERAVEVLEADHRVHSVRAGGSIGAGTADAWSDLDLEVVTHAEHHEAFLADRDHWLAAITPTVFLAETGEVPPGKHWNGTYTDEQRAAVAGLPPVSATADGLTAFGLGLAELLVTRARPLFPRYDLAWPADLARVTADRLRTELAVDARAWLF